MDYCARFLETAMKLQKGTRVTFPGSGDKTLTASAEEGHRPENINFKQVHND